MLQRVETTAVLSGVDACRAFFAPCFRDQDWECLWVAHVEASCRCIHLARYQGSEVSIEFPTRQIIGDALQRDSAGLVLAHNHPSGDPTPSRSDKQVTRRLVLAAEALDLAVLDHLIFAGGDVTSFRRLNLL